MKKIKMKINSKLYLILMFIVFIVVGLIYYDNYDNTIDIIKSEYKSKVDLIEQSIYNETKYTEIISKIAERDINKIMEENSQTLLNIYREDSNILSWDLDKIKSNLEKKMDIYVLDENLEVIASSIEEEVGLSLKEYSDFSNILIERLKGDKFESDEINFSIIEGELKKYSYIPTPDHKYLIELSVSIKEIYPELQNLNIVYLSRDLKDKYPFIEDIRVYKFNKHRDYSHNLDTGNTEINKDGILKKGQDDYIKKALETNEDQEQSYVDKNGNERRLKYIPYAVNYENHELAWWKSYVIQVLYNDNEFIDDMAYQKRLFIRSMIIISILYFGFSALIIYLIKRNREIAYNDHLTKLPNRKRFEEVMQYKMINADTKQNKIAILFFDLDKFKNINDTYGHNFGDKVLQEVANKIKKEIRKDDIVSRLGGDEFTGLISGLNSEEEIIEIVERMSDIFETGLNIDGKEVFIRPSIGISIYPDHGDTVEQLISKADDAMYEAKENMTRYKIYENKEAIKI